MVNGGPIAWSKRVTYRVYVDLLPSEWAKLRAECAKRRITGNELISSLLSSACGRMPNPPAPQPEPLPEPPPEEE